MIKRTRTTVMGLLLSLLVLSTAAAADIMCTECGMRVDMASKFSSRITQGSTVQYFCDIGDLFAYLKKKNVPKDAQIEVKDYTSGAWTDARKTFYVHAEKKFSTPMGWGVAAFQSRDEAAKYGSAMDFDAAAKALQ